MYGAIALVVQFWTDPAHSFVQVPECLPSPNTVQGLIICAAVCLASSLISMLIACILKVMIQRVNVGETRLRHTIVVCIVARFIGFGFVVLSLIFGLQIKWGRFMCWEKSSIQLISFALVILFLSLVIEIRTSMRVHNAAFGS